MQGLLLFLLLPAACGLIAILLLIAVGPRGGLFLAGGLGLLGAGFALLGVVLMALAGVRAERRWAEVTGDRIQTPDGNVVGVTGIVVQKPNTYMKWLGIYAEHPGGPTLLLDRLPPSRVQDIDEVARQVAAELGVSSRSDVAAAEHPFSPNSLATLCYLPVEGICVFASVGSLLFSRNNFVKFCARQSLIFFFLSAAVLVLLVIVGGLPMVLLRGRTAQTLSMVLLIGGLTPIVVLRIGVMLYAAHRARKGEIWVIPGMGWIVERWRPS